MDAKEVALGFISVINAHDVPRILALSAKDHVFIDAYGGREGRELMKAGWPGYFAWFPDY